jgi:hypothetical protein
MTWRDFLDIDMIAAVSKHVSGALAIIGGFVVIAFAAKWIIRDEYVGTVIDFSERVVVTACVGRAVIVMLWKLVTMTSKSMKGGGNGTPSILVA